MVVRLKEHIPTMFKNHLIVAIAESDASIDVPSLKLLILI